MTVLNATARLGDSVLCFVYLAQEVTANIRLAKLEMIFCWAHRGVSSNTKKSRPKNISGLQKAFLGWGWILYVILHNFCHVQRGPYTVKLKLNSGLPKK